MSLLILGGTNDALRLADRLYKKGLPIIYSLAGLIRTPKVDYEVITGGFFQYGGLAHYVKDKGIVGIVDVTHPYANAISDTAFEVAKSQNIAHWQFDRPAWHKEQNDQWFDFNDWDGLVSMLSDKQSVFITTGRLDQQTLTLLSTKLDAQLIIRTAIRPELSELTEPDELPEQSQQNASSDIRWIQAIGPFTHENEVALMQQYSVDALVSKNSGGDATVAKLQAARQLNIPVYLLKRPKPVTPMTENVFSNLDECERAVLAYIESLNQSF